MNRIEQPQPLTASLIASSPLPKGESTLIVRKTAEKTIDGLSAQLKELTILKLKTSISQEFAPSLSFAKPLMKLGEIWNQIQSINTTRTLKELSSMVQVYTSHKWDKKRLARVVEHLNLSQETQVSEEDFHSLQEFYEGSGQCYQYDRAYIEQIKKKCETCYEKCKKNWANQSQTTQSKELQIINEGIFQNVVSHLEKLSLLKKQIFLLLSALKSTPKNNLKARELYNDFLMMNKEYESLLNASLPRDGKISIFQQVQQDIKQLKDKKFFEPENECEVAQNGLLDEKIEEGEKLLFIYPQRYQKALKKAFNLLNATADELKSRGVDLKYNYQILIKTMLVLTYQCPVFACPPEEIHHSIKSQLQQSLFDLNQELEKLVITAVNLENQVMLSPSKAKKQHKELLEIEKKYLEFLTKKDTLNEQLSQEATFCEEGKNFKILYLNRCSGQFTILFGLQNRIAALLEKQEVDVTFLYYNCLDSSAEFAKLPEADPSRQKAVTTPLLTGFIDFENETEVNLKEEIPPEPTPALNLDPFIQKTKQFLFEVLLLREKMLYSSTLKNKNPKLFNFFAVELFNLQQKHQITPKDIKEAIQYAQDEFKKYDHPDWSEKELSAIKSQFHFITESKQNFDRTAFLKVLAEEQKKKERFNMAQHKLEKLSDLIANYSKEINNKCKAINADNVNTIEKEALVFQDHENTQTAFVYLVSRAQLNVQVSILKYELTKITPNCTYFQDFENEREKLEQELNNPPNVSLDNKYIKEKVESYNKEIQTQLYAIKETIFRHSSQFVAQSSDASFPKVSLEEIEKIERSKKK